VANTCGFVRAFFDVKKGPKPLICQLCIKTIDGITQQDFTCWHNANKSCLPHLPYYFLNMLQHIFAQQAKFLVNSLNTNKVEHGDNGSMLIIKQLDQTIKYLVQIFKRICDHSATDKVPSSIPRFTPAQALPSNQAIAVITSIAMATIGQDNLKKKSKASPPGTLPMTGTTRRLAVSSQLAVLIKLSLVFSMQTRESNLRIHPQTALSLLSLCFLLFLNKRCTWPCSSCPTTFNIVSRHKCK
jgi:hypothetical protein